jgi:phosphonate transport system substrate-binding protein
MEQKRICPNWRSAMKSAVVGGLLGLSHLVHAACLGDASAVKTHTFDVVPQFTAAKIHTTWAPLLQRVGKDAGLCFELKIASSIPEFEQTFLKGQAQFAYVNPYHAVLAHQKQKYLPLLADGHETLTGILVVRKDSPIQNIDALADKPLAFPAPNAFAASLLIRAELAKKKINIQPVFVKNHSNVYRSVIAQDMLAGGGVNNTLESEASEIRSQLRVLYETEAYTPHPIITHPSVSQEARMRFFNAMQKLMQDDEGKKLLDQVNITKPQAVSYAKHYKVLESLKLDKFLVIANP